MPIRLIAFDLDGTMVNTRKELPPENRQALQDAYEAGILLVPATGRAVTGLPEELRALPWFPYCICGNGARVYDMRTGELLYRAELTAADALRGFAEAEANGLFYDCYLADRPYMDRRFYDALETLTDDIGFLTLMRRLRKPVEDVRELLRSGDVPVMKFQMYFSDPEYRLRFMQAYAAAHPEYSVTSSTPWNIEVNSVHAGKGPALLGLCQALGLDPAETMAMGDGYNDISMLRSAGIGVAMANAEPEVKACADRLTLSCDEGGAAYAICHFALSTL